MQLFPISAATRLGLLITAAIAASPVRAADSEAIIVTAGRTVDPDDDQGVAIGRAEIELLQPASALDLLDRLPGVRAFSKGGAGGASYLSVRGGEPNFTLVLLDGIKVTDPTNSRGGAFDFAQIDPDALERIDVIKGALSAVHGADALSGLVSLQLRRVGAGERLGSLRAAGDSEGGLTASAVLGTGWNAGSVLVNASWYDSGDLTSGSDIERWQGFGRIEQRLGRATLSALALHAQTERTLFPEDSGGPLLAVVRERERRETELTLIGLGVAGEAGSWGQPRLSLSWMGQDDDSRSPGIASGALDGVPPIDADSRFERAEAIFDHRIGLGGAVQAALGGGYLHEQGESRDTIDLGFPLPADFSIERSVASAFAEATLRPLAGLSATVAIRFDDASTAQGEWSGRAALRWSPLRAGIAFFGSWSEGYKLPSLYALAYPIIANPDLRPERSRNFEAGAEALWPGGLARLSYFHTRYTDLIDFDPILFTNVNRARVTTQGIEAELRAPLAPGLTAFGNAAFLDTDVPGGVAPLRSRPRWEGLAGIHWTPSERLEAEASGAYTGDHFDSSVPTGLVTLESRFVVSVALGYRLTPALWLTISGENLLGADYEDAVGFPAPGTVLRLGLRLSPRG